jgi:hypothetical protein
MGNLNLAGEKCLTCFLLNDNVDIIKIIKIEAAPYTNLPALTSRLPHENTIVTVPSA